MRCQLCGTEASRIREGEGYTIECRSCGRYFLGFMLVREVLRPFAEELAVAVRALNDAGRSRVVLRAAGDIVRVLADAEAIELAPVE